jgi:hypothetical protein
VRVGRTQGAWLTRSIEERFLHFTARLLRRSEREEKASRRCGRNDRFGRLAELVARPSRKRKHKNRVRLVVEFVDYGDVGVDFDGETVEDRGFVAPLADGVEGRLIEQGVAFQDLESADGAVGGDDGVEFYCAFVADLKGERGVIGLDAMREHGGIDMSDVDGAGSGSAGDGGLGIVVAEELDAARAIQVQINDVNADSFVGLR